MAVNFRILAVLLVSLAAPKNADIFLDSLFNTPEKAGEDEQGDCAACTILFLILSHIKQLHMLASWQVLPTFCSYLPDLYGSVCFQAVFFFGTIVTQQLDSGDSADVICYGLSFCKANPGQPTCHLLPEPPEGFPKAIAAALKRNKNWAPKRDAGKDFDLKQFCDFPVFQSLCDNKTKNDQVKPFGPAIDFDNDGFSTIDVLHGYNWRGYDCSDFSREIYPGRIPLDEDRFFDSNCNGIWGVNPITGVPYETELCGDSDARGFLYFGDSIGAHFHFPPEWIDVTKYTTKIFSNLSYVFSNNIDWPELSFGTGHKNTSWDIVLQNLSTDSIYWRMRSRNLCNNNDYHNLAFNGANSDTVLRNINFNNSRHKNKDKPVFVIYAPMGNDVCNGEKDTLQEMTKPEAFRENVLQFFNKMEDVLPVGSHILTIGLLPGEYIYPLMQGHLHPIGYLNGDIRYKDVYEWLECVMISPCIGWMSSDAEIRNKTTERARMLNDILEDVSNTQIYKKFDVKYMRLQIDEVFTKFGDRAYELVEPFDGFHTDRRFQYMVTDMIWNHVESQFPHFIGKENVKNPIIKFLFNI